MFCFRLVHRVKIFLPTVQARSRALYIVMVEDGRQLDGLVYESFGTHGIEGPIMLDLSAIMTNRGTFT